MFLAESLKCRGSLAEFGNLLAHRGNGFHSLHGRALECRRKAFSLIRVQGLSYLL